MPVARLPMPSASPQRPPAGKATFFAQAVRLRAAWGVSISAFLFDPVSVSMTPR
jgi:hypothetical protein